MRPADAKKQREAECSLTAITGADTRLKPALDPCWGSDSDTCCLAQDCAPL